MNCTNVIDHYYNDIAKNYTIYIGQALDSVIKSLSINHIVKDYKINELRNSDIVLWESKRDKMAHVTVYNECRFYCSTNQGAKAHPVLLNYKGMLKPKYIVRLEG